MRGFSRPRPNHLHPYATLLYLGLGRVLMIGEHWPSELHHHAGLQLVLSPETPFSIRVEGEDWIKTQAVIINSNVLHQFKEFAGMIISFTIVPERKRGIQLQKFVLKNKTIMLPDFPRLSRYTGHFRSCYSNRPDPWMHSV